MTNFLASKCDFPIFYRANGGLFNGQAKEISCRGLFFETDSNLELNSTIDLEFTQPRTTIPIKVGANVVRNNKISDATYSVEVLFNIS